MQGREVYRAAGVVWWEPERGVLEPLAPQIALDDELDNIHLLLELTGKREARFAAAEFGSVTSAWATGPAAEPSPAGAGTRPETPPFRIWRVDGEIITDESREDSDWIAPLAAWQLPDRRYSELLARHDAWTALGLFGAAGAVSAYLVTCEDSGWVHEAAHSGNAGVARLRRHWQHRLLDSGDFLGMVAGADAAEFARPDVRWTAVRRRWLWSSRRAG